MKAMVYTAPLTLEVRDVPEPEPDDGDVLIAVEAVGICGSELEGFASQSPFRIPPLVMGHEFAGVRLDTGVRVVVNPVVSCRRCDLCLRGLTNVCRRRSIVGIQRPGAFAEIVAVPEANCYPIPDGLSFAGAALVEPLANAIRATRLAHQVDPLPQRVAVIGAGALGYLTAFALVRRGVPEVVVMDRSPARLANVVALGAHAAPDTLDGEFDIIFDVVGSADTRAISIAQLRPGGAAVWIGLHEPAPGFDGLNLIRGERSVLGTFCYQDVDFRAAIALVGDLPSDLVVSRPLAQGVEAFSALLTEPPPTIKTLLLPRTEARVGVDAIEVSA